MATIRFLLIFLLSSFVVSNAADNEKRTVQERAVKQTLEIAAEKIDCEQLKNGETVSFKASDYPLISKIRRLTSAPLAVHGMTVPSVTEMIEMLMTLGGCNKDVTVKN
ncbi:hypothetical protein PRIPAC_87894 [Pristionchus pacificus]|uniref:Uncharacterized protein n=1 Tax=Pristionchus pacificus TaxID=54126 RepID=A0A2A6B3W1_PRIPA|nr:hypothetical protein PRIPAC_87894 [Pristionchus pacificus]|eukprot:PDM60543.1 hypothetical protein PRIPAC_53521 [Pristionchus pacificus]